MQAEPQAGSEGAEHRRYVRVAFAVTAFWFAVAAYYIATEIGWAQFRHLPADTIGTFLEGVFAPLAFLWLVVGYFLQQAEIRQNTEALRAQAIQIQRTAEQAIIQSQVIVANEVHARQETFLRIAQQVQGQLGMIMGMLWISSQGAGAGGTVHAAEQSGMFAQLSSRDTEVFSRRMIETHFGTAPEQRYALFYGTPIRARHSNHFIVTFDRLVARAMECDPEGVIGNAIRYSGHGSVYNLAAAYQKQAPKDLADPLQTGVYLNVATAAQAAP